MWRKETQKVPNLSEMAILQTNGRSDFLLYKNAKFEEIRNDRVWDILTDSQTYRQRTLQVPSCMNFLSSCEKFVIYACVCLKLCQTLQLARKLKTMPLFKANPGDINPQSRL